MYSTNLSAWKTSPILLNVYCSRLLLASDAAETLAAYLNTSLSGPPIGYASHLFMKERMLYLKIETIMDD
jgi:hypothetical protein